MSLTGVGRSTPQRVRDALVRFLGIPALYRMVVQRRGFTVVYYHDITPELLDRHLSVLGRRYAFTPLRACVEALYEDRVAELPGVPLAVTLDDGLASNRALAEVFRAHGVEPTIFVCSGIIGTSRGVWTAVADLPRSEIERLKTVLDVERVAALAETGHTDDTEYAAATILSRDDIEAMRDVVDFQSHTVFHPILPRCTDERVEREVGQSRRALADEWDFDVYALAYPDGAYGEREVRAVREAGYRCAVTTAPGVARKGTGPFELPRVYIPEADDPNAVIVAASAWPQALKARLRR